jgi:hypothetical protein
MEYCAQKVTGIGEDFPKGDVAHRRLMGSIKGILAARIYKLEIGMRRLE